MRPGGPERAGELVANLGWLLFAVATATGLLPNPEYHALGRAADKEG